LISAGFKTDPNKLTCWRSLSLYQHSGIPLGSSWT